MMLPFFNTGVLLQQTLLVSSDNSEESSAEVRVTAKRESDSTKHEEADLVSKIFVSRFVFDVSTFLANTLI